MVVIENAKKIFLSAIQAVQPERLIAANLVRENDTLRFGCQQHKLKNNVFVVGFGKAVGGMCRTVQSILGDHVVKGALSVPYGLFNDFDLQNKQDFLPINDEKITIYEGAKSNLPDEKSQFAAKKILEICQNATENDLVIALVSGGGSALLPLPIQPLSLQDKLETVKKLAEKGATIQEINIVRKNISSVKGGRLAEALKPAKTWSLILSDIIGDPIELIASGPTVPTFNCPKEAISIIEKYGLQKDLDMVCMILKSLPSQTSHFEDMQNEHVCNVIVGSNSLAIDGAISSAQELNYKSVMLSKCLMGEAKLLGIAFAEMCNLLVNDLSHENLHLQLKDVFQCNGLSLKEAESFSSTFFNLRKESGSMKLCVIGGGETTVTLTPGHGLGGRNQEMVLAFASHLHQLCSRGEINPNSVSVTFLSGGTDGQDGPTTAAGAYFCSDNLHVLDQSFANQCLENHNSNIYFQTSGDLLVTGLTGTNVMDIQILLVEMLFTV